MSGSIKRYVRKADSVIQVFLDVFSLLGSFGSLSIPKNPVTDNVSDKANHMIVITKGKNAGLGEPVVLGLGRRIVSTPKKIPSPVSTIPAMRFLCDI